VKNPEEKSLTGRLFVPSLVVAFFSTSIIEFLTSIFLLDVTETFFGSTNQVFIATTSQLVTLASVVSVIFAVILGALSVSYNHKKLLFLGSIAVTIGILGCLVAPNFLFMQIFFPIEGIGTTIIGAMALTLVGEFLILSERPKAIGWIMAGGSLAAILGSLVIALFFSGAANWRSYLLWFALPISLVSLTAVYLWVPSAKQKARTIKKQDFINSFKQVFLQKSAASCLIGIMLRQAAFAWAIVYYASFLRTQFGLSLSSTALLSLVGAIILATALVTGGYLVQKIGRKRQPVSTLVVSSLLLIPVAFLNDLAIILILSWVGGFIFGMSFPATTSLILEQVPESRGTMMSMSTVFVTLGMGLGTALGGAALVLYDWTGLILIFATIQLIAAAVYFFLARDPCKT
jgi:MFS transporter, DHA1 family, inner membrane transport protein